MIVKFDQYWNYLNYTNSIKLPTNIIVVNNLLYVSTSNSLMHIFDQNLTMLASINTDNYTGLYFNQSNKAIYAANSGTGISRINILSLNLTIIDNITLSGYSPWALQEFKNLLYVGTTNGSVLVVVNKTIINVLKLANINQMINFIWIDQFGYMTVACTTCTTNYLYFINGTSINGISVQPQDSPTTYVGFDTNQRLILASVQSISIHY